jgi:hypothetical protein
MAWMLTANVVCHSSSADLRDLLERGLVRGVVDQNVDSSELVDSALDYGAAMLGIAQVPGDQHDFASRFFEQGLHLVRIVVLFQICDQDVRALTREGDGHGAPDAAVAPGDHCLFARQFAGAFVAIFAMIGTRIHLTRGSWRRLLLTRIGRLRMSWGHDKLLFPQPQRNCNRRVPRNGDGLHAKIVAVAAPDEERRFATKRRSAKVTLRT